MTEDNPEGVFVSSDYKNLNFIADLNFLCFLSKVFSERPDPPRGIVLDLQYLPSLEYFTALLAHEIVYVEAHETFQRQTWRNRCQILTAHGGDTLIVPVVEGRSKVPIREARIDYGQKWVNRHWRAIRSAYGKAPFFEHFGPEFENLYRRNPAFLFDLNWELLTICLAFLGLKKKIVLTERCEPAVGEQLVDARGVIHPKRPFTEHPFYRPVPYRQVFREKEGERFFPNLSILDVLFTQGPQALPILLRSVAE